jgi:hypothetical protein
MADKIDKSSQNGGLPSVAVARAMLATAPGRKKLDLILDSADPRGFVRRLPAEDLYFAVREIGLSDSVEIIGLAAPSQFRSFVDLDAWENQLPDIPRVMKWLQLAMEGARHSGEFRQKRKALDSEIVLLILKTQTIVHSLEENEDPVIGSDNFLRTAEGKYLIEITVPGEEGVVARRLIEDFIEEDPFQATRLFEATRWEQTTELEESAARWRTGRMRDMGFPEFEEAIRIWSPLPGGWKPRSEPVNVGIISGVPALLLATSRKQSLLDRTAERLPDDARPLFNEGLLYLLNCAIVADGVDPKDLDLARSTLAATRDMLSLGLELASNGEEEEALRILATNPPVELFRLAVARVLTLSRSAVSAAKTVVLGQSAKTVLDSPDEEILTGLRRKRPRLYDPPKEGEAPKAGSDWRALRDRDDIAAAEAAILRAKAAGEALVLLGITPAVATEVADAAGRALTAVTVSQFMLTAALRTPSPLQALEAKELSGLGRFFDGAELNDAGREDLSKFFGDLRDRISPELQEAFTSLVTRAVKRFEDELGPPLVAGGLDPRFVECVLVRQTSAPEDSAK